MGGYSLSDWLSAWRDAPEGPLWLYFMSQRSASLWRRRWTLTLLLAALFISLLALERWLAGNAGPYTWPQPVLDGNFAAYFGWFVVPLFVALYCIGLFEATSAALSLLARLPGRQRLRLEDDLALSRQGPLDVYVALQRLLHLRLFPIYLAGLCFMPLHLHFVMLDAGQNSNFVMGLPWIFSPPAILTMALSTLLASVTVMNCALLFGRGLRSQAGLLASAASYVLLAPTLAVIGDSFLYNLLSAGRKSPVGHTIQFELLFTALLCAIALVLLTAHLALKSRIASLCGLGWPSLAILGVVLICFRRAATTQIGYSELAGAFEHYCYGALLWASSWAVPLSPMAMQSQLGPHDSPSRMLLQGALLLAGQAVICGITTHYALAALREAGLRDSRTDEAEVQSSST